MRRTAVGLGLAVLLALAGCAGSGDDTPVDASPPSVVVTTDDGEIELAPWSFCWSWRGGGACGDGFEPDNPPPVGAPMHVDITFPEDGWLFDATFTEVTEEPCPLTLTTTAEPAGDGVHRLDPIGPAGDWQVRLFGTGPQGDLAVTFVWTTSSAADVDIVATETVCQS